MGLETAIIALTVAQGAASVAGTLEERKAVKQQSQTNARIERRNAVQKQADLNTNASIEAANRKEKVMDAASSRRDIQRQARKRSAQTKAQSARQGVAVGSPSLDSVLQDQAIEEEIALNEIKLDQGRSGAASRNRERVFDRDAFAVREIGETNAQAIIASGKNRARSLGLQAIGQGLSTAASVGTIKAANKKD